MKTFDEKLKELTAQVNKGELDKTNLEWFSKFAELSLEMLNNDSLKDTYKLEVSKLLNVLSTPNIDSPNLLKDLE